MQLNLRDSIQNLDQDIKKIEEIQQFVNQWVLRGVRLQDCIDSLNKQQIEWVNKIQRILRTLASITEHLVTISNRIGTSDERLSLPSDAFEQTTNLEKHDILQEYYHQSSSNIVADIEQLKGAEQKLLEYKELGMDLGNASEKIQGQISFLSQELTDSKQKIQDLSILIQDTASLIIREEEESVSKWHELTTRTYHSFKITGEVRTFHVKAHVRNNNDTPYEIMIGVTEYNGNGLPYNLGVPNSWHTIPPKTTQRIQFTFGAKGKEQKPWLDLSTRGQDDFLILMDSIKGIEWESYETMGNVQRIDIHDNFKKLDPQNYALHKDHTFLQFGAINPM